MGTSVSRYTATAWKANGEALRSKEPSHHRYSHRLPSKGLDLEISSQTPPVADHVQSQGRHDAHPPQWVIGTATWTSQNRDPVLPRQWANGTGVRHVGPMVFVKPRRNKNRETGGQWTILMATLFLPNFQQVTSTVETALRFDLPIGLGSGQGPRLWWIWRASRAAAHWPIAVTRSGMAPGRPVLSHSHGQHPSQTDKSRR